MKQRRREKELPDWVTKVLGGNPNSGTQHADDRAALVEELEGPVVDVGLIKLEVVGEIAEKVRHGDPSTRDPAASPPARRSTLTSQQLGSNRRAKQPPESLKLQRSLQSPVTELGLASLQWHAKYRTGRHSDCQRIRSKMLRCTDWTAEIGQKPHVVD